MNPLLAGKAAVTELVRGLVPQDALAREHRDSALSWLAAIDDIYRRVKPAVPNPHLVSYVLPVDRDTGCILLGDHRRSGLWLPPGGHVEPDEHPAETARREAAEELGIAAIFDPRYGSDPFFLTVTDTVGAPDCRHTDVSLWFALATRVEDEPRPDPREFTTVRWWTLAELARLDPTRREPHLLRALVPLGLPAEPSEIRRSRSGDPTDEGQ